MQIQHNLPAMEAARQQGINSSNYKKTSEKLASGYKINRAADGAAQLSISEKMRWQIRGLKKSIENSEDGANYIQVADGAMNEIHDMLHRMREISIQSLNDTNTPADRAALAAEFDNLQSEIDRINTSTDYNTQPVFEEYTDSYYKIEGNRKWTYNQIHSVEAPNDNLHILLPGSYNPNEYSIHVPGGVYTTQELIDEIEDAFTAMTPENPGFTLEFTKDGFCDLVFQSEDGSPTEITCVDGYLSYLIYDNYNNNTSASLLGTTQFEAKYPLEIVYGKNDTLSFRIENRDGTSTNQLEIKIPPGKYSRGDMISLLNTELAKIPEAANIVAKAYGDKSIQITGGTASSITSLKGNMFTIETTNPIYSSVFYDNICPAVSYSSSPSFSGAAYYHKDYTTGFTIDSTNDTLAFTLEAGQSPVTVTLPHKTYVIDDSKNDNNLVHVLNEALDRATGGDVSAVRSSASVLVNGRYITHSYIRLQSKSAGSDFKFTFPSSTDPAETKLWSDTYKTLFTTTNQSYVKSPSKGYGSSTTYARLYGAAYLSTPLKLNSRSLSVKINGTDYDLTIPKSDYSSLNDLTNDLTAELKKKLPADLQDKISFKPSGSCITIQGTDKEVKNISVNNSGAYEQLFTRYDTAANYDYQYGSGQEQYQQGSTAPDTAHYKMASVTMGYPIPEKVTTIDNTNDTLQFYLNNSSVSVKLDHKTYNSPQALVNELNSKLDKYPVTASLTKDNHLVLTTTPTGTNTALNVYAYSYLSSGWKAFLGTSEQTIPPTSYNYSEGSRTSYQGVNNLTEPFKLTDQNRSFKITMSGSTTPITVTLDKNKDYTKQQLCDDINAQLPADTVEATVTSTGCIRLEAKNGGYNTFTISPPTPADPVPAPDDGSFYSTILGDQYTSTMTRTPSSYAGTHSGGDAFVIGREDLRNSEIKIVPGINDTFTVDLNFQHPTDKTKNYTKELTCKIPAGTYSFDQTTQKHGIAEELQKSFQEQLDKDPKTKGLHIEAAIGGYTTNVTGADDKNALSIAIKEEKDANGKVINPMPDGTYQLDGVRGSAAYYTFYKTTGRMEPSYVVGIQDITKGVDIGPDNNELILSVDDVPYSFPFPDGHYTADQIIDHLNNQFKNGPNPVPLVASVVDGKLKISYEVLGPHDITGVSGSAKGTLFYAERSRESLDAFMLQVSERARDGLELPHLSVGTVALGINSVTISRPKYADKALVRLDRAIDLLSAKRSTYGALHNRIEHIIAQNGCTAENTQSSESRLRDADMAAEMIEHVKHRILMQASDAVLAQANQLPNIILNMLS